jgi:hypothetical protein
LEIIKKNKKMENPNIYPIMFFDNVEDALAPLSAGSESKVCVICCPCGSSGGTVTSVSAPHPTWTNLAGKSVVLLDAIQLGGINGLNG